MTLRINSWSGPRNISTALMRSFGQRADTRVVDEPLYGHYLATTGAPHPALKELLDVLETDARAVVDDVILGPSERPVLFLKQMVHHLTPDLDTGFLERCVNVLLVRDPAEVIASLVNQLPEPTMRDVGIERQASLFKELRALGQDPPVVDSRQLLLDPEHVLKEVCERIGLEWDPEMLSWPAGPRPEDGPWAPHWYENVWRSTGFAPYVEKSVRVPKHCDELLERCQTHYDMLSSHAIRARAEVA
jgi:hypothetical protein